MKRVNFFVCLVAVVTIFFVNLSVVNAARKFKNSKRFFPKPPSTLLALPQSSAVGGFTDSGINFTEVQSGSLAWGDYDNDGDLDLVVAGLSDSGRTSNIYRNNGDNTFTDINAALPKVDRSSVAWGDYDNDGDLDLVICGCVTLLEEFTTKIYRNDGSDTFTDIDAGLIGVASGTLGLAWGDYDNDGDLDLALCGHYIPDDHHYAVTKIYRNDGSDTFTDINAALTGLDGTVAWGDYNNDGYLDLGISGWLHCSADYTKIYKNNGNGTFTDIGADFGDVDGGFLAWGDYDNDGDLDIAISIFYVYPADYFQKIFRNDGNNQFTEILEIPGSGKIAWGDYDNDGDLDFASCGRISGNGYYITRIYRNDGNDTFTDIDAGLPGAGEYVAWGDYDNDGDLDLAMMGKNTKWGGGFITKIYKNNLNNPNAIPFAPVNLTCESESENSVLLKWDAGYDAETPEEGLYYDLQVGTSSGANDIVTGVYSSPLLGNYLRPKLSDDQLGVRLKNLPLGQYYWSVHTIDTGLRTSAADETRLPEESTFEVLPSISGKVTLPAKNSVVWVKVPEINPETPTTIYMYYDSPSAEDGQNKEGVWDDNFKGVWHLNSTQWQDSTSNQNHGTALGDVAIDADSKTTSAAKFDGVGDVIKLPNSTIGNWDKITLVAWVKMPQYAKTKWPGFIAAYTDAASHNIGLGIWQGRGNLWYEVDTNIGNYPNYGTLTVPWDEWFQAAMVYDGTNLTEYLNAVKGKTSSASGILSNITYLGLGNDGDIYGPFTGLLDEVRISNVARSNAWLKAEYNSMNDNLISFGEEVEIYGGLWNYRRAITIDPTKIDETLVNFPICVKLDNTRIRYTGSDGKDIRFTDSLGSPLSYEIESWNETGAPMSDTRDVTDVTLTLSGDETGMVNPDIEGNYSFIDLAAGGTYTITPELSDYYFVPQSRSYSYIDDNQINQDFTAVYIPFLSEWPYKKTIVISGSSVDLTDYQVKINVEYEEEMRPDFADLRFVGQDDNILDYWVESYSEYETAVVWVKVPSIPTTGTSIDMYYGNPEAESLSNGDNTFIFFDDFTGINGNDIDTTKWGWINQSNNRATYDCTYARSGETCMKVASSLDTGGQPYHRFDLPMSNAELTAWVYDSGYSTIREALVGEYYARCVGIQSSGGYYKYRIVENPTYYNNTTVPRTVGWHKFQMRCDGIDTSFYIDDILVATIPGLDSFGQIFVGNSHVSSTTDYFDDVSVRRYSSPEPIAMMED